MKDKECFDCLKFYYDEGRGVHIMQENKVWINGRIVLLKEDHCVIEDRVLGCKVIFFKDIFEVSEYREKK